jgi:cytochrome c
MSSDPDRFQPKPGASEPPEMPPPPSMGFLRILLILGGVLLLATAMDLLLRGTMRHPGEPRFTVEGGNPDHGRQLIISHGCVACHVVPGIREARGRVGPQLTGFRDQMYIAGMLPNEPKNLIHWIQFPQHVNPRTAMPNLQVTEAEARDIAAYLYSK